MDSEFSEFSYGFAATTELAFRLGGLGAAPVFPSLVAEARLGWDVRLQTRASVAVFIQFKIPQVLTNSRAAEWSTYSGEYYRIFIRKRTHSNQHNLLKALAAQEQLVYYLSPRFYQLAAFDAAYVGGTIIPNSVAFPLRVLPLPSDNKQHYISFRTGSDAVWHSPEVQTVEGHSAEQLPERIVRHLRAGTPLTIEGLLNLRSLLLDLANRSEQSRGVPDNWGYGQVVRDIEYLSRTFLSAEMLFVTEGRQP